MQKTCKRIPPKTYWKNHLAYLHNDPHDWTEIKLFKQGANQALKTVCKCGWENAQIFSQPIFALIDYYKIHLLAPEGNAIIAAEADYDIIIDN